MRQFVERDLRLRLVKAPHELRSFHFPMAWHPRLNTDARHTWLHEAIRQAAHPEDRKVRPPQHIVDLTLRPQ
jgi:hypothetical protein